MSLGARACLIGLIVQAFAISSTPRAQTPPPVTPRFSPVLLVPRPARSTGAEWDSLERFERTGRWAASESLATTLIHASEAAGARKDSLDYSRALFYFGNSRLMRRLYADGRGFESLERGIGIRERRAGANDTLCTWAHVKAATLYPEAGDPDLGLAHGEVGLRRLLARTPTDTSMLAQAHLAVAAALIALGRDAEAGPHFEDALHFRERADAGEGRLMVPMLAEYGGYLSRAGELDRARAMLQRAVRIAEHDPNPGSDFYAQSLGRLSSFENRVGNVAESIELAWRAYDASRRLGEITVPALRARTVLAYRLQDFGDPQGSVALLREIIPGLETTVGANNAQTLNARLALVWALIEIGDTATAERELAAARPALATQNPRTSNNPVYAMQLSGDLAGLRGFHIAARETLAGAVALERVRHDPFGAREAVLLAHLMDNLLEPADRDRVLEVGRQIDRLRDSTHVRATPEWHTLLLARGSAEGRVGLQTAAWEHALEAERLSRELLTYQLEALPDVRGLQLARALGGPCELLAALVNPDSAGRVATAWDRIVRWRGVVGHEIARRRAPVAAASDSALAAAHARWVSAQRQLAQLVVSGAAHPDDPESAERFSAAFQRAEDAERAFLRSARGSVPADSVAGLDLVLDQLDPHQALIAFTVADRGAGPPNLGAFIADGGERQPRWITLGPLPEIEHDIRSWVRLLAAPPTADRDGERACRELGQKVRSRVWDPVRRAAGNARELILVAEGVVTELPWLALPEPHGKYLADTPLIVRLVDAERDLLPDRSSTAEGRGLLAVGGPNFGTPEAAGSVALASAGSEHRIPPRSPCVPRALSLSELPSARREAEGIARSWPTPDGPSDLLVGAEASEFALKTHSPGKAVIHVATHGVMLDDTCRAAGLPGTRGLGGVEPLDSPTAKPASPKLKNVAPPTRPALPDPWLARRVWLALAGANRPVPDRADENEGLLTAEEVVTLDLRGTQWVVLSACYSGAAQSWAREGVLGMNRAFHLAGARAVIASRWAVGDESATEWMTALYESRARHTSAGAAVGEACRTVLARRRAQGRTTHPFYWAAFSATGD